MNKRTIVIGDVHGCYKQFMRLLDRVKYDGAKDKLILLGDYIDRGKDSYKVVKKVQELQKLYGENVVALMGNHEKMLLEDEELWIYNGGNDTKKSYRNNGAMVQEDLNWFSNLPYYHEDGNYIFVHAYVDVTRSMEEQDKQKLVWEREFYQYYATEKSIVFGHTPTTMLGIEDNQICAINNSYAIDTACVYGGRLSALIINIDGTVEDESVEGWYKPLTNQFYPIAR